MRRVLAAASLVTWACGAPVTEGNDASTDDDSSATTDATGGTDATAKDVATSDATAIVDAGSDVSDATLLCPAPTIHEGGLTQYDQTSANNCGVPWPTDNLYAAISTADYDSPTPSGACGKCLEVTGPTGTKATFRAVDQCPVGSNVKCVAGHLDLSHTAYAAVVPSTYPYGGEVPNQYPVAWHYVACTVSGNITYHFDTGTSPYWVATQIRNARYGISKVLFRPSGTTSWTTMTDRTDAYAYFTSNLSKTTTLDFQVIDEHGHTLEDDNVTIAANTDHTGAGQFPLCP